MATSLPGLLLKGLSMGAQELANTYTGKKLFDMMKSINKNKTAVKDLVLISNLFSRNSYAV